MPGARFFRWCVVWLLVFSCCGCEAFVRKFTRKPKKDLEHKAELVLEPQEYEAPRLSKEELYRQHLLYWRSWHDELIQALDGTNRKKQLECAQEALDNLVLMRAMISAPYSEKASVYIKRLEAMRDQIGKDAYGRDASRHRSDAERLRAAILRELSYQKVKNFLL